MPRKLAFVYGDLNAAVSRNERRRLSTTQVGEINCEQARLSGQRAAVEQHESLLSTVFFDRHTYRQIETNRSL